MEEVAREAEARYEALRKEWDDLGYMEIKT